VAVGVFSSAKGGACLRASDRDGLSCAAKQAYASEHVRNFVYASTVCEFWSENEQNAGVAVCETEVKHPQNANTTRAVITQNAHGELVRRLFDFLH